MTVVSEDLRLAVYGEFAHTGRAPTVAELAEQFGLGQARVREMLESLHAERHLVIDDEHRIVMAHPFASIPLGFAVMGSKTLWWGGCAWDSFALPHVVPSEPEVLVATTCPGCQRALAWLVDREKPPAGAELAHFLVPARRMWDDVVHTCGHQRLFCDQRCIDDWLVRTGNELGCVLDLATLWRLASRWYDGRLERGYRRREPERAVAYFREVGLSGGFWGLPEVAGQPRTGGQR